MSALINMIEICVQTQIFKHLLLIHVFTENTQNMKCGSFK